MGSVQLGHLTKKFQGPDGSITACDNINLEISDGEFVVLVGPSGSGKSTILRMIAGLESVTDGKIHLGNRDITGIKPKHRDIAMVFQNYSLYPHLNAKENMSFGLRMRGELSKEKREKAVDEAASIMDIEDLLEKMPDEMSGGQQQRIALGRAIVRDPEIFLMDEPLSNLDAKLRSSMRTEIQRIQTELEVTTVYVTHDQTEAMTMGDKIAVLNKGKLQQYGPPMEVYQNPGNRFVASFIGDPQMNFVEIETKKVGEELMLENPEFEYFFDQNSISALSEGESLTLGIRPEDIRLSDDQRADLLAHVEVKEPLGRETLIYFGVDGTEHRALIQNDRVNVGDKVGLNFPEERIYLFDNTGDRYYFQETSEKMAKTT